MKHLASLVVLLVLCASGKTEEPTLEWTLKYMIREIPEGSKESWGDAMDYRKHRKDFNQQISVKIYTVGFKESMAKASTGFGTLMISVVPCKDGRVKLYGHIQLESLGGRGTMHTLERAEIENSYGKEKRLGSSGFAKSGKKPGQPLKGVDAFILIVKKVEGDISKLAEESIKLPRPKKGLPGPQDEELTPPKPKKDLPQKKGGEKRENKGVRKNKGVRNRFLDCF